MQYCVLFVVNGRCCVLLSVGVVVCWLLLIVAVGLIGVGCCDVFECRVFLLLCVVCCVVVVVCRVVAAVVWRRCCCLLFLVVVCC